MLRRLLTPGWLALHAVAVLVTIGLVWLGFWQWERGAEAGRVQNYAYGIEWWLFAAFAVFLWVKTIVDALEDARHPAPPADEEPPPPAPVVTAADEEDDPELAAYNRHLAELHARSQAER